MDPTLQLIQDLEDPSKFRRVERVAVFKAHQRKCLSRDGKPVTIRVTEDDLKQIANNTNAVYSNAGKPTRLTIGHIKQDPNYPEHLQPKLVGFAKDYRAELVKRPAGTFLAVTHVEYLRADEADEVLRQYPYRSPEYDHEAKVFGGVALLTRDPWLDTGAVYVYSAESNLIHYQAGNPMNEDQLTPEEEMQYEKLCKYMKGKYPKLAQYMDDPASTNVAIPGEEMKMGYQKTPEYTLLEQENRRLVTERELDQLAYQGVRFDRSVELPRLLSMKPEERTTHINYMKATYAKSPVGLGMIPLAGEAEKPSRTDKNRPLEASEMPRVLQYQAEGLTAHAAIAKVIAERK